MKRSILCAVRWLLALAVMATCWDAVAPRAHAQATQEIQRIAAADRLFEQGLNAYQQGNYDQAVRRFLRVTEYPTNQKTTAALLMAGRALYQRGDYQQATSVLRRLQQQYPASRYRNAAEDVLGFIRGAEQPADVDAPIRLGVALPLGTNSTLTQAMFNGIRLAVEERNGLERELVPVDTTFFTVADTIAMAEDSSAVIQMKDTMRVERTVETRGTIQTVPVPPLTRSSTTTALMPSSDRYSAARCERPVRRPSETAQCSWRPWRPTATSPADGATYFRPTRRSARAAKLWHALRCGAC